MISIKKIFLNCSLLLLLISCSNSNSDTPIDKPNPIVNNSAPWKLLWQDNFDTTLDQWNVWNGGAFNNEIQLYQAANLQLEEGLLVINATRKTINGPTTPFDANPKEFLYTSGRIESKKVICS